MAAPNIVNVSTITGKTSVQVVTTSSSAIVENTASSGKVFKVNSIIVSNVDAANSATITCDLYRSSTSYHLAANIAVPIAASLVVLSKETAMYLEEGDAIRLSSNNSIALQATCSYEEIS